MNLKELEYDNQQALLNLQQLEAHKKAILSSLNVINKKIKHAKNKVCNISGMIAKKKQDEITEGVE